MTALGKMYDGDGPVYFAALAIWALGVFFSIDLAENVIPGLFWGYIVVFQVVLTITQRNLFKGRNKTAGIVACVLDAGVNTGGIYFVLKEVSGTDLWRAVNDALGIAYFSNPVILLLSFVLGVFIAAGPEFLIRYATNSGRG